MLVCRMPKLPDMSDAAVLKRLLMKRSPPPVQAEEKPKVRIAKSRTGKTVKKKAKA